MNPVQGKTLKLGGAISANRIIRIGYCTHRDPDILGKHCFKGEDFIGELRDSILVGDEKFGSGSVREHPVLALIGAGVRAVVAKSFSTAFYRNAINNGLPVFQSPEAAKNLKSGIKITIDIDADEIRDESAGESYPIAKVPEFIARIRDAGGIKAAYRAMSRQGE